MYNFLVLALFFILFLVFIFLFYFLGEKSAKGTVSDFLIDRDIVENYHKESYYSGSNENSDKNENKNENEIEYDDRIDNSVCLSLNSATISLQSKNSLKKSQGDSTFAVGNFFEFFYPINKKVNGFILT